MMQKRRRPSPAAESDSKGRSTVADKAQTRNIDADEAVAYKIKLRGHLAQRWSDWLGGLEISHDAQGCSLLTGVVPDQAALHGILAQIRDLGLPLISIIPQHGSDEVQVQYKDDSIT
jgi:hypothetical protein